MAKMNNESWREQTIEGVGVGKVKTIYFDDTKPNYILLTNPCHSPLYVSTSPAVSDKVADIIIPVNGRQLFSQMNGVKELYIVCYDSDVHSVRVKSWEGEFDPVTLNQTQETVTSDPNQSLGNVVVTNFPSTQEVNVKNPVTSVGVNNFPAIQKVNVENPVTSVGVNNFPTTQDVNVLNPVSTASIETKLDSLITLMTANNEKLDQLIAKP
ncbi:hypothetical protein [Bacillus sp. ISL-57]|uniref:hypothetical protein n=1 Tax=Bacillus sp. ISL-57 TaxID=2819135 RepID=UPI001BE7F4BD|nr:hypothetical protein [Bacillus sp. ISL-57]MBT2718082.1 hypothetical protein [Bacillus sp. ISL-57]